MKSTDNNTPSKKFETSDEFDEELLEDLADVLLTRREKRQLEQIKKSQCVCCSNKSCDCVEDPLYED